MAIDPSIALQLRPFQMEPRTNALARLVGLQGQMRQNALGELQAQEVAAGLQEKEALRRHLQGAPNLDTPEGQAALYGVAPTQAGGILKGRQDLKRGEVDIANVAGKTAKDAVSADADRWKIAHEKAQKGLELIAGAKDQASYDAARAQGQAMGLTFQGPERFDPAFVENAKNQALSVVQRLEQDWKAKGYQLDVNKHGETVRHNKSTEGTAQGQLGVAQGQLGLSRQRLALDQSQPKGQYDAERGLLIDPRTSTAQPVTMGGQPIGGKDEKLNEGQSKALMFGSRMADARGVIDKLEGKGVYNRGGIKSSAETVGRIAGLGTDGMGGTLADVAGSATNWTQSKEQQSYEAAKRNWLAAVLRKESGAAIGAGEYRDADNQYFPQPGDSGTVKAEKSNRRRLAEQAMLEEVPKGIRGKYTEQAPKAARTPGVIDFSELK